MQMRQPSPKTLSRTVLSAIVAVFLIGPVGEFVIEYLKEQGVYDEPTKKVEAVVSFAAIVAKSYWFALFVGLIGGVYGSRRVAMFQTKAADADLAAVFAQKLELAGRAQKLATVTAEFSAEIAAQNEVANTHHPWDLEEDHIKRMKLRDETLSKKARDNAKVVEKYNQRHSSEFWSIVEEASRLIKLDDGKLWPLRGAFSSHDLGQVILFLQWLAAELRQGRGVLEPIKTMEERFAEARAVGEPSGPVATE